MSVSPTREAFSPTKIASFAALFQPTVERGGALDAVSHLDSWIGDCLKALMVKDAKAVDLMFSEQGTLNSFGAKIRFAYLFGVASEEVYKELRIISKIRNHFAHREKVNSFSHPLVQGPTSSLKILTDPAGIIQYVAYAWDRILTTAPEPAWDEYKTSLRDKHNIDLSRPNWAFTMEVVTLAKCFEISLQNIKKNEPLTAPLF